MVSPIRKIIFGSFQFIGNKVTTGIKRLKDIRDIPGLRM
jgi:hypothetical protein